MLSNSVTKSWLVAGVVAGLLFLVIRPRLVQAITREELRGMYLASQPVNVAEVAEDGEYRQVEYEFEGERRIVSQANVTNAGPDVEGEYMVWMAQIGTGWQIFRYSFITEEVTQLTMVGNNIDPAVYGERVIWEGFVDGGWQIFMFDGVSVEQITFGTTVVNSDLYREWLAYQQKTGDGFGWRLYLKSLVTGETLGLGSGSGVRYEGSDLVWDVEIGGVAVEQRLSLGVPVEEVQQVIEEVATNSAEIATSSAEVATGSASQ